MANDVMLDLSTLDGYEDAAKGVNPEILKVFNWNGKQFIMPVGVAARTLGYRTDFFKEAGIEIADPTKPLTMDQIVDIGKKLLVEKDGKVVRYAWNPNAGEPWYGLVTSRGGSFFDNFVNPTKVTINTPEGIAGLKDFQRLFDEKVVPPWAEWEDNQWGAGTLDSLQTGTIAMADIGPWSFADIRKDNLPIGNMVYPVGAEGEQSILHSGANGYGINARSQHPNEAWTFIKWMLTKDAQLRYAQWSDIPATHAAFDEVFKTLQPAALLPSVKAQLDGFRPVLLTDKPDLEKLIKETLRDMSEGKLTPEEAAEKMETEGNAILSP
jgi:ABC-type glycerol-3-phosphate transport system substrate-binding protein